MSPFLKAQFCLCFLLFLSLQVNAQYVMQNALVTDCEGTLSDSELGPESGQYDHNEEFTFTICVQGASAITAIFDFFATESDFDVLTIHDGPDTNAPIIAELHGVLTIPPIIVASSGCMTIHFVSDDNIVAQGWLLNWEVEIEELDDPELMITSDLDCPLASLDLAIDLRIPCDILVPENFQLLGPDFANLASVTPLDCDSDNTASIFNITFNDSLSLSGSYNLLFNGYIINTCGDTLTFESLVGFELEDCPFEVEIVLIEQACPGDCGLVEVTIYSSDEGPFEIAWDHTLIQTESVDICADSAFLVQVFVENTNTGSTARDEFWYEPYKLPLLLNPLLSDTFCSNRSNYRFEVDSPGGLWNSNFKDNSDDPLYRFWKWNSRTGIQEDILTYTDERGCSVHDTFFISPINAGLDQAICLSEGGVQLTGNNPSDGVWDGPNTSTDGLFSTSVAGTFSISYSNDYGCRDWKKVYVVDQIEFDPIDSICSNIEIDLKHYVNSLGGTWTGPGISNWYHGRLKPWEANINEWNTYFYQVEGCLDSLEIYVKGIWAGPDLELCGSTDIIQMRYDGLWSGPGLYNPLDSMYDISGVTPGNYEIKGARNGCEDLFNLSILEVNIDLTGSNLICYDAGRIPIEDIVQSNPKDGVFTGVGIVDDQGSIYFDPSLISTAQSYIVFEAINCRDSILIQIEQELPLKDYMFCEFASLQTLDKMGFNGHWEGPGILSAESGLINLENLSLGINEVYFISENGCETPVSIEVVQYQEAEILDIEENYCFQDTNYLLTLSPPNGIFTINDIVSTPQINPAILGSGYHELEYTVGVDECEDKFSIYIAIEEPIAGSTYANFDTLCPHESTSIFVETSGGNGSIEAIWDLGLGFGKSHIISPDKNTTYSVTLSDGCSDDLLLDLDVHVIDTFNVDVNYGPEVCFGDSSYIELLLDRADDYSITWNGDESPDGLIYKSSPGTTKVLLTNILNGCKQEYDLTIPGSAPLGAGFQMVPNQDCIDLDNNELNIIDLAYGYSGGYISFGETEEQVDLFNGELTYTYENIGEFDITQIVFNDLGCSDTLVETICVENVVRVFVPNVFSPNGDGENDLFKLFSLGVKDYSIHIYDRWGSQVFTSNDINVSWDGKFNDKAPVLGVYIVVLKYKDQETGQQYLESHDVLLVK